MRIADRKESPIIGLTGMGGGLSSYILYGGSGSSVYEISRSLRFNSADSAYLSRSPTGSGNRKTFTFSSWIKFNSTGGEEQIINAGTNTDYIRLNTDGTVWVKIDGAYYGPSAIFRDFSAWYHWVIAVDTTQATDSNRIKMWVNGVQQTLDQGSGWPDLNALSAFNNSNEYVNTNHAIGIQNWNNGNPSDFYLADTHWIDGQALTANDFGEYDDYGVWNPKEFTGTYPITFSSELTSISTGNDFPANGTNTLNVFDGSTSTGLDCRRGNHADTTSIRFAPSTAITGVTKIRVWAPFANKYQINGGGYSTFTGQSGWSDIYDGASISLSTLDIIRDSGNSGADYGHQLHAIEINDVILTRDGDGNNSFHLKYDDTSSNAALGTDSSGNSNTWSVNNIFGTIGPADYASGISIPEGGGFYAERPPTNAFDGDTSTFTLPADTSTSVRWTYDSSWNLSGAVEVYPSGASMTVTFDDGRSSVTAGANSWTEVSSDVDFNWINLYQGASLRGNLVGIRVNGTILINSTQSKLNSTTDSPSLYSAESGNNGGNYCTLNPQDRQINSSSVANGTVSNGNLSITSTGAEWTMIRGTMFVSSGKWYWECELGNNQYSTIGVITDEYKMAAYTNAWVNQTTNMFGYYPYGGSTYNGSNTNSSYATADTTAQGQVIGVALDMDNGTLTFYKNGVSLGQAFAALRGKNVAPAHWLYQHSGVGYADNYNFGQQPFRYTPPTDHLSLCTTNLAETAILDASKHFDVLTWSGNGPATQVAREITGLDMESAPDFVWAKTRTGSAYHNTVFDAGRGYGADNVLVTDEAWDQGSATGGRMKSTSSSSITFEPAGGVDGNSSVWYDESGHTYVAWNWNAGSNSNRTYNVTVVDDGGNNRYRLNGHGNSAVTLELEEGSTYVFDSSDSSVDDHPFVIGTSANSNEYSTGVTYTLDGTNVSYSDYRTGFAAATTRKLTITVPTSAPTLYYWCSVHSGMGGQINTNTNVGSSVLSGSLTSSYYNTDAHWSLSSSIGTAGNVFDGSLGTSGAVNSTGSAVTITTSSFSARRIRFYKNGNDDTNLTKITVNGTDYFFPLQTSSTGWQEVDLGSTITVTSFTTTWYGNYTLYAIEVDGKILTDSTVTPTSVPTVNTIVRANQAAGFSIVRWQGDSNAQTVAHGLAGEPSFIIAKNWNADTSWRVYHNGGDFNTVSGGAYSPFYHWVLDTTATRNGSAVSGFTNTRATSTHFSVAGNFNTDGMVAYCFQEIEGYSKFGTYLGNGLADGPFVFTGFRPRWLLIRRADGGGTGYDWHIFDSERDSVNQMSRFLGANTAQVEQVRSDAANYTDMYLDFLSNGFKWRNTYSSPNNSGGNFIYAAFAENPFRTSRAR